jgi:hypothetical protein
VADPASAPAPASAPPAPAAPASAQPATSPPDRSISVERPPPRESPSANSNVNVNINVLGVLQLGLVPGIEFGGRHVGFTARLRLMTTGVLSHFLLADTTDDEEFASGLGFGGVLRYYSGVGGNLRGFYVGGGLEYVSTRVEDSTDDREAYETTLLVPEFDMGYRWVWGRFLLDLGGTAGYAIVQSKTTEDLSGGQDPFLYPNNAENQLYAMGVVDLGFFF